LPFQCQRLDVNGTLQADGTVLAREVTIAG
jgi:hypothetical protein